MQVYNNGASHILRFKGESQEEVKRNMLGYLGLLEGALNELSGGINPYFGGKQFEFMDITFITLSSPGKQWGTGRYH